MKYDAIIVGGGAAGLFCAATAAARGRRVLVLEHNREPGRKILISGGGRCNFTNRDVGPENFLSQNRHFCKSALARYTPADFTALVRRHRIAYYEKTLGQLFCRDSSRQIVDMLLAECREAGAEIRTGITITDVDHADGYTVRTSFGDLRTHNVVVACGGLSFPKIGATAFGYRVASKFGLRLVETRPSLVALVMGGGGFSRLAGISTDAAVQASGQAFRENILFTHRGLSGPAILQASNYWKRGVPLTINLSPATDLEALLLKERSGKRSLGKVLSTLLPYGVVDEILGSLPLSKQIANLSAADIKRSVEAVSRWQLNAVDTEGYDRAEVTLGGVSTDELSSSTMESKRRPGLYFIGEVVDVTGWLGGYNFQWAWASGYAAGQAI